MYPLSIVVFFVLCYGFGYIATFFIKNSDEFFEKHLMRIGIGLGTFVSVGLLLNLLHIPLDYRVFLLIIAIGIAAILIHRYWKTKTLFFKPAFSTNIYTIGMLILFGITFYMHHTGAFSYPYLENDDPWAHAVGTKYVALEKTIFSPLEGGPRYIDPYPPAYGLLMGVLHQTNTSVYWTLKFFNVLIISLCIVFFYYFSKHLTSSSKKAFFSTAVLFAVPAFMSHFIWAIALTMPLFFVAFYLLERLSESRYWIVPSVLVIAAVLVTSPTHSAYFGLFAGIYLALKTIIRRRFIFPEYSAVFGGLALSSALWWVPMVVIHGVKGVLDKIGVSRAPSVLSIGGTADRQYYLSDFIHTTSQNMINNPTGLGMVVSLFFVACIILLIIHHRQTLLQHTKSIFGWFLPLFGFILMFLGHFYVKNVQKRTSQAAEVGSVPFGELIADQMFMILMLGLLLFMLTLLTIKTWKDPEFKDGWLTIAFGWGLVSFYAVMAGPFHIQLSPFRAWMIVAIPFSLLAGEGIFLLLGLIKGTVKSIYPSAASAVIVIALLLFGYGVHTSSFAQKFSINTAQWSPGGFWTSGEEIGGYVWMRENIAPNSPIFSFSNPPLIIAFDQYVCWWCSDVRDFTINRFNSSADEITTFLKESGYSYILIDGQTAKGRGINATTKKLETLIDKGYVSVYQSAGFIMLKLP